MSKKIPEGKITSYEVITQKDDNSDDIMLPIPPMLLEELGWKPGDEIEFGLDKEGKFILTKVKK